MPHKFINSKHVTTVKGISLCACVRFLIMQNKLIVFTHCLPIRQQDNSAYSAGKKGFCIKVRERFLTPTKTIFISRYNIAQIKDGLL